VMALLFVISIVSGAVVYGPSMRKLDFGTVRKVRTRRIFWLDLHNLIGITLIVWTLVVGITGLINTWADSALKYWQQSQLKELSQAAKEKGKGLAPISVQSIVAQALNAAPGMMPLFVAYPGSAFSTDSHYVVFLRGEAALTSRLVQPIVVDAKTGLIASIPIVPWYIKGLLLSQPLHFANYGGLPLRIVWALLDVLTIILLVSGFYLWLVRRASAQRWQMQAKRSTAL